jgi:RNA polymerase sigma-70 factor (ECF subfamily)
MEVAVAVRRSSSDTTLARAQRGDTSAFADLLHEHQAMVFSIAYHCLGDRSTAEDVAQDVFLRLFKCLHHVESPSHLMFWLRQVTSRCCIDRFRHRETGRIDSLDTSECMDDLPASPVVQLSRDFLLEERLRELVRRLPLHHRLVITLRYQEDLDPSEIAAVLDMPLNTVKSHLHRSVKQLRAWFAESGGVR